MVGEILLLLPSLCCTFVLVHTNCGYGVITHQVHMIEYLCVRLLVVSGPLKSLVLLVDNPRPPIPKIY